MQTLLTACYAVVLIACMACAAGCFLWARQARVDAEALTRGARRIPQLADDLTALHARVERLAGRVYAQTRKPAPQRITGGEEENFDLGLDDPELAAEIALQSAPPVAPGKRN